MNDISGNVAAKFHSEVKAMSLTPLPPPPKKVPLWYIFFALLKLKFRESTVSIFIIYSGINPFAPGDNLPKNAF